MVLVDVNSKDGVGRSEHQRMRNRMKQKRHRDRYMTERSLLRAQVEELSRLLPTVVAARKSSLVPWRDVAAGLAQASVESRLSLEMLRAKCEELSKRIALMTTWVGSMTRPPSPAVIWHLPLPTVLLADIGARKHGLDWFTQHMYFNTDRALAATGLHATSGSLQDLVVVDRDNGFADIIGRIQVTNHISLEATFAALQDKIWAEMRGDTHPCGTEFLDEELVRDIDPRMVYRRTALTADESNYYVCREFVTENRIVFLFGNFNQDALQPVNIQWRPRMFWYVLERIGPTETRIKALFYNGPKVVQGRVMTWKEDMYSCHGDGVHVRDVPDDLLFSEYQQSIDRDWRPMMTSDVEILSLRSDAT